MEEISKVNVEIAKPKGFCQEARILNFFSWASHRHFLVFSHKCKISAIILEMKCVVKIFIVIGMVFSNEMEAHCNDGDWHILK